MDHFLRFYCGSNNVPLKRMDPEVMQILEEDPGPATCANWKTWCSDWCSWWMDR
jgi:hypothetical protein